MKTQSFHDSQARKWSMLLIYNINRLVNIVLLFGLFWVEAHSHVHQSLFIGALVLYLMVGIVFLYIWKVHAFTFKQQTFWAGTIDIIAMVLLINAIGYIQSGLGILLNALIAMLSILIPGRVAIFFAAIASCMLLTVSIVQFEYDPLQNFNTFFSTGIYGAGFFATALTALYFANRIRSSENLAKERGRELENLQRLNEYIVGRLQYGVIYVGADRQVKLMNTAARQFFNYHKKRINLTLEELSSTLNQKYMQFFARKKKDHLSAYTILEKPHLQVHFYPASLAPHPAVLIILDDMAAMAQQVQQLKLASLGRFSASIAHELRNPLGIISHAVQLMGDGEHLSQEDNRLQQLIVNNCNRMNAVIQNVLQVSRRQQAKPELIELTTFLNQFKHEFCLINVCGMTLVIPQNKKKTIYFDKNQLEQVLVILCDNAMQHGRDAEGHVRITISVKHEGARVSLLVCDKGAGIPRELRDEVYEPFFSTVRTGNGMGLFIARDLCEINQASLCLCETKQGCCFSIALNGHELQL